MRLVCSGSHYDVFDVGSLGGDATSAYAINDDGLIVGQSWMKQITSPPCNRGLQECETSHGFALDPSVGTMAELSSSSTHDGAAYSIDSDGVIALIDGNEAQMLRSPAAAPVALNNGLPCAQDGPSGTFRWSSYAFGVAAGVVVGSCSGDGPGYFPTRAFVVSADGHVTDLFPLVGDGVAYAVNKAGVVVGEAWSGTVGAFLYNHGAIFVLGGLGRAGSTAAAFAINDANVVAGAAFTTDGKLHATRWDAGGAHDLGALAAGDHSAAFGINMNGQVVGWSGPIVNVGQNGDRRDPYYDGPTHAFLFEGGKMLDLNEVAGCANFELLVASAINDRGDIVGTADGRGYRGFLLKRK